jgi:hypothetical protein
LFETLRGVELGCRCVGVKVLAASPASTMKAAKPVRYAVELIYNDRVPFTLIAPSPFVRRGEETIVVVDIGIYQGRFSFRMPEEEYSDGGPGG